MGPKGSGHVRLGLLRHRIPSRGSRLTAQSLPSLLRTGTRDRPQSVQVLQGDPFTKALSSCPIEELGASPPGAELRVMSTNPTAPLLPPRANRSPQTSPLMTPHSCDSQMSPCPEAKPSQHESASLRESPLPLIQGDRVLYRAKSTAVEKYRRHSADEVTAGQRLLGGPGRFHPYRRQYSGGGLPCEPSPRPPTFDLFQGVEIHEAAPVAQPYQDPTDNRDPWGPPLGCILQTPRAMGSEGDFLGIPEETPCYPEQIRSTYGSLPPLEPSRLTEAQFPMDVYSPDPASSGSQYIYHCATPQAPSNPTVHSGYPKPIYSYSILIFMALRSSKTGSLPVSEIYSFMTENFPYFKTAPDGWKNSVRHNLSLNKCFEKVENKNGNASRKGCLWALNPAKVEKMQEELHKWRRKDPLTVRRSMARPEELDRLLGDHPGKWKPLRGQPAHPHGHTRAPCCSPPRSAVGSHAFQQDRRSPSGQPSLQLPPSSFPYCYPHGQQHLSAIPLGTADLESPRLAHVHLGYGAALQASHCAPKGMQELLLEGDLCNDVDTLNPSLTDLQLHGHLWEELKDDSLAPDSLVVIASSPSLPGNCVKAEVLAGGTTDEKGTPSSVHFAGLYSAAFASMDSVASCVPATGRTPIALL